MNAKMALLALFTTGVLVGCEIPPNCTNDDDCCSKPNPVYTCQSGTCAVNQYYYYNNELYTSRVRHCLGYTDGQGGSGDGGSGGNTNCKADLPINPNGLELNTPEMAQQCQSWCWAAGIAMVANYYGKSIMECELAGYKSGYGPNLCCSYGCTSGCDQTATPQQIVTLLSQYLGLHGMTGGVLSEHALQVELSSGRPVYAMFQGSFSGHVAIIKGFMPGSPAIYHLIDPWYGPQDIPYYDILKGPNGEHWAETISRLSPYANGCVPDFNPECANCY